MSVNMTDPGVISAFADWGRTNARLSPTVDDELGLLLTLDYGGEQLDVVLSTDAEVCSVYVPNFDSLPGGPSGQTLLRAIAAVNFAKGLFRIGVDPSDGEIRLIASVPIHATFSADDAALAMTQLDSGAELYRRMLGLLTTEVS